MAARVTQRVDPGALDALLERPPRAALAWDDAGRIETLPVAYRRDRGRHWVGIDPAAGPPERAVLVIDDGRFWFELRALTLRGRLAPAPAAPPGGAPDRTWLELVPERVVAWDYAALREEPGA